MKNQYSKLKKLNKLKGLKNSEDGLFKDSFYMILSNLYSKLILYLFFLIIPFMVGTEGFGVVRGLLPITDTIVIFFCSGIPPAMAKFISEDNSKKQMEKFETDYYVENTNVWEFKILKYMVFFSFFGALLAISLKYILGGDYKTLPDIYYYAIALSIPLSAFISWSRGVLQGNLKIKQLSLTWILEHTSKVVFLIPLALFFGITGVLLSVSVGYLLGGLLGLYIIFKYLNRYKRQTERFESTKYSNSNDNKIMANKVLIYAIPIALTATSYRLLNDLDSIFIMSILGAYDNGLYGYASLISKLLFLFAASISTVLIPRMAKSNIKSVKSLKYLKKSLLLNFTILLPLLAIFIIFANDILKLSFGISNVNVSNSLIVLSLSASVMSIYTLCASSLQGMGYAKIPLYVISLGIVLNAVFNLLLIPIYGILGGAFATLLSSTMISVLMSILTLRKLK
ncbi:flippase [Methanococcus voltae]|uniref:Polysaccharide biosynthesis protein n=1 Tax=Methanococcus voltae (strain ATCC BAA-1334 / A3) TaxID=456320 RepID=D7DTV5_METV3